MKIDMLLYEGIETFPWERCSELQRQNLMWLNRLRDLYLINF